MEGDTRIPLTLTLSDSAEPVRPMGRGVSSFFPSLDPVGFADLFEELCRSRAEGVDEGEGEVGFYPKSKLDLSIHDATAMKKDQPNFKVGETVCYFGPKNKKQEPFPGLVLETSDRIKISYFDAPEQRIIWVDPEDSKNRTPPVVPITPNAVGAMIRENASTNHKGLRSKAVPEAVVGV